MEIKPSHGEMHLRLGEFLTEMGRVENDMFILGNLLSEAPTEALFEEYAGKTFGQKIKWLKPICDGFDFPPDIQTLVDAAFANLAELLPKRNSIVHGETYGIGQPPEVYRLGVTKDNVDYLTDFVRSKEGTNVFTAEQVRAVTILCLTTRADLMEAREKLQGIAEAPTEEHDDPAEWPPPKAV